MIRRSWLRVARMPNSSGLIKRTQPLMLWPIVARVLAGLGMIVVQSMWDAHREEVRKAVNQGLRGDAELQTLQEMTREEAARILDVPHETVVLRATDEKKAKENFRVLRKKCQDLKNPYLEGKVVGAYKKLIDKTWTPEKGMGGDDGSGY